MDGCANQGAQAGSVVVSYVTSAWAVWSWLVLLLSIHIATNRAAVRAVSMHTLNRQRSNVVMSTLLEEDRVLRPEQVSRQERIFEWDGALRWKDSSVLGSGEIGVDLRRLLQPHSGQAAVGLQELRDLYGEEQYLLWYDDTRQPPRIVIALKQGATNVSQLKAWTHALLAIRYFTQDQETSGTRSAEQVRQALADLLRRLCRDFDRYIPRLREAGWDVDAAALETRSGSRISFRVAAS